MTAVKQFTSTALAYPVLGLFPSGDCELFVDDLSLKRANRGAVDDNLVLIAHDGVVYEGVFFQGKTSAWRWHGWRSFFKREQNQQLVVERALKQYPLAELRNLVPICLGARIEGFDGTTGMNDADSVTALEESTTYGQLFAFLSRILL